MSIKEKKNQIEKLRKLLDAAGYEADKRVYDNDFSGEENLEYRQRCFNKVEDYFWNLAKGLASKSDYLYYETREQAMEQALINIEYENPDWLIEVLEEIEE